MITKPLFMLMGHLATALGVIGIFLPIMPTTPFLLLASYCYSKGSEKFHKWLHNHKHLGPPVKNWEKYGSIPFKVKAFVIPFICLNLVYVTAYVQVSIYIKGLVAAICLGVIGFIATRPSHNGPQVDD
ncbi:MAG: YbaN family protein [Oligoflexales bacterium]|nr:YbaN family protein [Oligoflexales bacterium]